MDPSSLISPVTDALSTLGSGLFEGVDPTAMLKGISQTLQSTGGPMQQSVNSVGDAWQGESGTAAAAKATTAMANGQEVSAQSEALRDSLASAAANVAQARARLIAIITEFAATMAAIGPSIVFPWGWAAAIAAANKAIASTAEVMTELQATLGTQAAQVTAAGAPVSVTAAPEAATSSLGGLASPLMSMATKGAQAGIQAGTGAASAASQAAAEPAVEPIDPADSGTAGAVGGGAALGRSGGGSGGGTGGTFAARSLPSSPFLQAESSTAPTQSAAPRVGGTGGSSMMGGAPYAPMGGQGANASSNNNHTSAAFLHTTDQGGEIVGDLGSAAPPVLGEADPYDPPDIELRI